MGEIVERCSQCGGPRYHRADAWSGITDAFLRGQTACRTCRSMRAERSAIGPIVLGVALVVAPLAGFVAAFMR
jgi:hypothetical protein